MTTSRATSPTINAQEEPGWGAGLTAGVFLGVCSFFVPLLGRLDSPDAPRWLALATEQAVIILETIGWPLLGTSLTLLGLAIAIVAFVGMRDAPPVSRRSVKQESVGEGTHTSRSGDIAANHRLPKSPEGLLPLDQLLVRAATR